MSRRLIIAVEGHGEENFVRSLVAPHLGALGWHVAPRLLNMCGKYQALVRELGRLAKEIRGREECFLTTLVDYYGLAGAPKLTHASATVEERKCHLEAELAREVALQVGDEGSPFLRRFRANFQMHEFEALLFSNVALLAEMLELSNADSRTLARAVDRFETPEHINDHPEGAPSKRITSLRSSYPREKEFMPTFIAQQTTLPVLREKCRLFGRWLSFYEDLAVASNSPGEVGD